MQIRKMPHRIVQWHKYYLSSLTLRVDIDNIITVNPYLFCYTFAGIMNDKKQSS